MSDTTVTATPALVWPFRIVFTMAAVEAAVVFGFFIWGVADGSITSFNIELWLGVLALVGGVPAVGWLLRRNGRTLPAILLLSFMALPGLLYLFFLVLIIASGTSWN